MTTYTVTVAAGKFVIDGVSQATLNLTEGRPIRLIKLMPQTQLILLG